MSIQTAGEIDRAAFKRNQQHKTTQHKTTLQMPTSHGIGDLLVQQELLGAAWAGNKSFDNKFHGNQRHLTGIWEAPRRHSGGGGAAGRIGW